jgi:hypothetical protein
MQTCICEKKMLKKVLAEKLVSAKKLKVSKSYFFGYNLFWYRCVIYIFEISIKHYFFIPISIHFEG